jgi:LacI family transcriptional regulator
LEVTLKDVAREAGVNLSTASRSMNNAYGVHPKTREHVLAVAQRMNYRPNQVARGLATGRSHSMALVVSDIRNPFFAEVARGAEDAAYAGNCDLVLCNSDLNPEKQMRYLESLLAKRVDGILMNSVSDLTHAQQEQVISSGVPVVLLNRNTGARRFSTVVPDNVEGGQIAARYLTNLGHTKIAHLSGPRRHGNLGARTQGFVKFFQSEGVPAPLVIHGKHTLAGGYEMAKRLLTENRSLTAIFAANDVIAFGCIRAAAELGIRIPADLSIIGFDNVEISQIVSPPLTTIHQPKYELGKSAMELLLQMVSHPDQEPEQRIMGVRLVERQSCQRIK